MCVMCLEYTLNQSDQKLSGVRLCAPISLLKITVPQRHSVLISSNRKKFAGLVQKRIFRYLHKLKELFLLYIHEGYTVVGSAGHPLGTRLLPTILVDDPVLSDGSHRLPRVSTIGSFFTMTLFLAILITPSASVTVTTMGRPSGMAATAKLQGENEKNNNQPVHENPKNNPYVTLLCLLIHRHQVLNCGRAEKGLRLSITRKNWDYYYGFSGALGIRGAWLTPFTLCCLLHSLMVVH